MEPGLVNKLINMHPLVISGLISCIVNLLIGAFVFTCNPRRWVNRLFALFSLTVSGWSVGSFLENVIPDKGIALNVLRLNYLFGIWLPAVYLHFAYTITRLTPARSRILRIAYGCALVLSTVSYTPLFIRDVRLIQQEPYPFVISAPGPMYYLFFTFFAIAVTEVLRVISQQLRISEGFRRLQMSYLVFANAIAIAAGFEYFSRVFGLFHSPPIDDYILVMYFLVLAYAIIKHRLMDIRVIIRRSLIFSILVTILTVGYFVLVYAGEWLLRMSFGYHSIGLSLVAFALMALVFQPLKVGIQRAVERCFFRAPHEELIKRMERLEQEVRKTDQMKAVAILAAGLAHEIKNPLTAIKTFTEFLPTRHTDAEFREKFHRIVGKEVTKIDQIVRHLLDFAKPVPTTLQPP